MKYLILGSNGFVAYHYINFLVENKDDVQIFGVDISDKKNNLFNCSKFKKVNFIQASLLDRKKLRNILIKTNPDYIIHLAAQSSVAFSWQYPYESFTNNIYCFLNLLEELRFLKGNTKVLLVGSSEEYGKVSFDQIPIKENVLPNPLSPYAISRAAQNQLAKIYSTAYNLKIICSRSFNHVGPFQLTNFVVSSFVKQAVEMKFGLRKNFECGNIELVRDFIDVRDVIGAYELILTNGKIGETYNVCSGIGYALKDVINIIKQILQIDFEININKLLLRPCENEVIIGSNEKLCNETKFKLQYSIRQSIYDMIKWQEKETLEKGEYNASLCKAQNCNFND